MAPSFLAPFLAPLREDTFSGAVGKNRKKKTSAFTSHTHVFACFERLTRKFAELAPVYALRAVARCTHSRHENDVLAEAGVSNFPDVQDLTSF